MRYLSLCLISLILVSGCASVKKYQLKDLADPAFVEQEMTKFDEKVKTYSEKFMSSYDKLFADVKYLATNVSLIISQYKSGEIQQKTAEKKLTQIKQDITDINAEALMEYNKLLKTLQDIAAQKKILQDTMGMNTLPSISGTAQE